MSAETPAEFLRRAAKTLRERAEVALGRDRPWRHDQGRPGRPTASVRTAAGWEVCRGDDPLTLRYIATMHPGVGAALAALLERAARHCAARYPCCDHPGHQCDVAAPALQVARAVLGEEPEADCPDAQTQDAPPREPHPTQTDMDAALAAVRAMLGTPDRAPGPLCRCGHAQDRHTPRPGDAWPTEECAACPGDGESPWANPQHHRYTPAQDGGQQ